MEKNSALELDQEKVDAQPIEEKDTKPDMPTVQLIIDQIKSEHKASIQLMQDKRTQFRERLRLYNNQRKQREKIGITTLYNTINILLAIYYTDELTVSFEGRKVGAQSQVDKWNKLAQFDHSEMNLEVINYQTEWDRLFFGVGIRALSSFDKVTKTPIAMSMDPLSWLPDPRGGIMGNKSRWHGFEIELAVSQMTAENGYIPEAVKALSYRSPGESEHEQTLQLRAEAQGLTYEKDKQDHNPVFVGFNWFTIVQGKKYLITIDQSFTQVVRVQYIKPVTEEEKQDESKVPFPISLSYYSPNRDDPFGTSICDLVEDKQRIKSVLANLRVSVEKARLYPMYLYNRHKILNRRDLDFGFNKFIGVNGAVDNTVVQPLQKDLGTTQQELLLEKDIDREVQLSTGADEVQAGIMSPAGRTASEIQQTQQNANLRFILHTKIKGWGEKDFWKLWCREYKKNFAGAKVIRVTSGYGSHFMTLNRKDFITVEDPDISILSKTEQSAKKEKDRVAFSAAMPLILQDPTRPAAAKKYAERHYFMLLGLTDEQVNIMSPKSPDELSAEQENEFLSRNENADVDIASEDHLSHMLIHEAAEDTPATRTHIEKHKQAFILSGQRAMQEAMMMAQQPQMQGLANQAQAQIGAQASQQQAQNTTSQVA